MEKTLVEAPYIGATVIFVPAAKADPAVSNGVEEIPAIVTRDYGDNSPEGCVNLKCLPDGPGALWRASVQHQTLGVHQIQEKNDPDFRLLVVPEYHWRWPNEPRIKMPKVEDENSPDQ